MYAHGDKVKVTRTGQDNSVYAGEILTVCDVGALTGDLIVRDGYGEHYSFKGDDDGSKYHLHNENIDVGTTLVILTNCPCEVPLFKGEEAVVHEILPTGDYKVIRKNKHDLLSALWILSPHEYGVGYTTLAEADNFEEVSLVLPQETTETPTGTPARIDGHYDFFYELSGYEAQFLQVKVDPYFVAKQWRIGERDNSGALFHILKTVARFGDKNEKEREIKAIYLQIKRLAELEGVELLG